jgi:hypothetical protein
MRSDELTFGYECHFYMSEFVIFKANDNQPHFIDANRLLDFHQRVKAVYSERCACGWVEAKTTIIDRDEALTTEIRRGSWKKSRPRVRAQSERRTGPSHENEPRSVNEIMIFIPQFKSQTGERHIAARRMN